MITRNPGQLASQMDSALALIQLIRDPKSLAAVEATLKGMKEEVSEITEIVKAAGTLADIEKKQAAVEKAENDANDLLGEAEEELAKARTEAKQIVDDAVAKTTEREDALTEREKAVKHAEDQQAGAFSDHQKAIAEHAKTVAQFEDSCEQRNRRLARMEQELRKKLEAADAEREKYQQLIEKITEVTTAA